MMFINEDNAEAMLEAFTLEEILEMSNMTELEALTFLIDHGLIEVPPFLERYNDKEEDYE